MQVDTPAAVMGSMSLAHRVHFAPASIYECLPLVSGHTLVVGIVNQSNEALSQRYGPRIFFGTARLSTSVFGRLTQLVTVLKSAAYGLWFGIFGPRPPQNARTRMNRGDFRRPGGVRSLENRREMLLPIDMLFVLDYCA